MTDYGPWSPGIGSQIPLELRHLCTILHPQNVLTSVAAAFELQQLTGLTLSELVAFRPERLLLHELMIRVMADFSVPDGSRIGDLGINFREMTNRLLERHVAPELPVILREYADIRRRLAQEIRSAWAAVPGTRPVGDPAGKPGTPFSKPAGANTGLLSRWLGRKPATASRIATAGPADWGPAEIADCESKAAGANDPLQRAAWRSLARVMAALFATNGRAWGTPELICSLATDMACNTYGSEVIGRMLEPILRRAAPIEGYSLLPRQQHPVIINTKGPSASGKSSLRPLQKRLAGDIGVRWADFALISPDIWRKQLLDYNGLGEAFKYAGAFTSEELQLVDQKLDRYMARKHERGEMAHLLIDRFRFDSFAPDSDEAGSNLLTRFGESVYLFFVITPPEQLVERAWMRGLEFGRYKAVDDTLAHGVEAYTGMPNVFFTWVRRTDKRIHFELLDNSVPLGSLPRTVAFGDNYTLNVFDIRRLLDIERFGRVDVNASGPENLYPHRELLAPEHNTAFLRHSIDAFREVNFADPESGRIYVRIRSGATVFVDREGLRRAIADPEVRVALAAVAPCVLEDHEQVEEMPHFLNRSDAGPTLGQWGPT